MGKKARDDAAAIARLEELYARIPAVKCQGKCQDACTAIRMSAVEDRRIRRKGVAIPEPTAATIGKPCPALNDAGRCSVYEARPLICRAYGAAYGLPCPYACEVEGQPLDDATMMEFLNLSYEIGGGDLDRSRTDAFKAVLEAARRDPQVAAALRAYMVRGDQRDAIRLTMAYQAVTNHGGVIEEEIYGLTKPPATTSLFIRQDRSPLGLTRRHFEEEG